MKSFTYKRADNLDSVVQELSGSSATLLAGGTNLLDLMKKRVEQPTTLIDITRLPALGEIKRSDDGLYVGATVRNSDLANAPVVLRDYPLLSQAILAGASPQLRNMATTGGNLMQRTRCYYFYDPALPACNKRAPSSGCGALAGFNRIHAVLGQTDEGTSSPHTCIATNPSDMSVALAALDAEVHISGPDGDRTMPVRHFHRLPGNTPELDTNLQRNELITGIHLPAAAVGFAPRSYYLKVRDRQSYAFALVSVAAGLQMNGDMISAAAFALGGVAHKPWTSAAAENALLGQPATEATFQAAAIAALEGARGYSHNNFKIELAKRCIVQAFSVVASRNMDKFQR